MSEQPVLVPRDPWAVWRRFRRNQRAVAGGFLVLVFVVSALLAPWLAVHDPIRSNLPRRLEPPSREHVMGTDSLGRDMFSRVLHGGRISLAIGVLAVAVAVGIGAILGALAGYYGRLLDSAVMRFVDLLLAFPTLYLYITLVALVGPNIGVLILILGGLGWTGIARIVRAEVLKLRAQDYVEAARALGLGDNRIIFRHIMPNAMAPVIVATTLGIPSMILAESALSFLGLGVMPPHMSWGSLVNDGLAFFRTAWWLPVFPGTVIFLCVLGFNFLGDGLRDALDPRLKT
jgi:peptide/nickel transport system permease protein